MFKQLKLALFFLLLKRARGISRFTKMNEEKSQNEKLDPDTWRMLNDLI